MPSLSAISRFNAGLRRFVGSSRQAKLATTLTIGTGIKAQWQVENLIRG
jgi:hypothetical protein